MRPGPYSRNTLLSLRNCWKASSLAGSYGSVIRPIPEKTWQTLSFYNLLVPRRGHRGGNHLRDGRSITRICDTAAREFRRPKITSSGANYSNLLNIQIATSKENTTAAKTKATTQPSTSKFLKSKLENCTSKPKISEGEESFSSAQRTYVRKELRCPCYF